MATISTINIRVLNAETSTTSAPTASTDGIPVQPRPGAKRPRTHLRLRKGAASGTRTARVKVHGYESGVDTLAETGSATVRTAVASSGAWYEIFDTETLSDTSDFNKAYLLEGAEDYNRLALEVVTNGGTTPTLTAVLAFGDEDRR